MLDIKYVQKRLDSEMPDGHLPLRSWCRDLITKVRELEKTVVKTTLAVVAYKEMVNDLQDNVQYWENRTDDLKALQKDNENENNA